MTTRRQVLAMGALGALSATVLSTAAYAQALPQVTLQTSMGNIVIELDTKNAPLTSANFIKYVESGFYDGTIFHRVIGNFMIQGGGFTPDMSQKETLDPIKLEISPNLSNVRGTLAMARTNNPDSATAQFFINVVDNPNLNGSASGRDGYAVFGRVISGMDIVDKIRAVPTGNAHGHQNVPVTPVLIEKATLTH